MTAARAPRKTPLRAVKNDDSVAPVEPVKPKPMTLVEAVESGNYLEILRAQRRDIVDTLPDTKGPAKAALHRQLSMVSHEIQQLELKAKAEEEAPHNAKQDDGADWDANAI